MAVITPYQALTRMRQLSELGIPFSFEFYSYNSTKGVTEGYKIVELSLLRLGLRSDKTDKAQTLIAYTDYNNDVPRFFNLPLLMKFNGIQIRP